MSRKQKNLRKQKEENNVFFESLILIAYGLITILTPGLQAFDSGGTKFLALAIFNILVLMYFVFNKRITKELFFFYKNKIGLAYSVLILVSLLSFVKAININESLLHFSKILTIFIATWFISIIVFFNKKALYVLSIAMCLLLLFDCFSVFRGIVKFINKEIKDLDFIKSVYSNRNVMVSSIFLKIPFALVLFVFYKKKVRFLGGATLAMSILSILFMSSRAFYIAIVLIVLLLFIYFIIRYRKTNNKSLFKRAIVIVTGFLICIFIFTIVQSNLYPKKEQKERSIVSRVSSIFDRNNLSNKWRLEAWERSVKLIKKEPILGVGLGNWKIRVLEYENKVSPTYIYMYKAHNDFLEITAESGVIGGVSYILIFIFIASVFVRKTFNGDESEDYKWYFLFFLGILGYSFDAFFNFPQNRPEVQVLFAIIVGGVIGLTSKENYKLNKRKL